MRIKKELNVQIGERIKAARENVSVTQETLAERTDVSPQYISDLERGVVGVSVPTLRRICMVLGVSSDQLLFGTPSAEEFLPIAEKCRSLSGIQYRNLCEIIEKYIEAVAPPKAP